MFFIGKFSLGISKHINTYLYVLKCKLQSTIEYFLCYSHLLVYTYSSRSLRTHGFYGKIVVDLWQSNVFTHLRSKAVNRGTSRVELMVITRSIHVVLIERICGDGFDGLETINSIIEYIDTDTTLIDTIIQ